MRWQIDFYSKTVDDRNPNYLNHVTTHHIDCDKGTSFSTIMDVCYALFPQKIQQFYYHIHLEEAE